MIDVKFKSAHRYKNLAYAIYNVNFRFLSVLLVLFVSQQLS